MHQLFEKMTCRYDKPVRLHSGGLTTVKYDTDLLTDGELEALARMERMAAHEGYSTISIGRGGLRFAKAIREVWGIPIGLARITHIVDDVATTGKTLADLAQLVEAVGCKVGCVFVIVNRNRHLPGVESLFQGEPVEEDR